MINKAVTSWLKEANFDKFQAYALETTEERRKYISEIWEIINKCPLPKQLGLDSLEVRNSVAAVFEKLQPAVSRLSTSIAVSSK